MKKGLFDGVELPEWLLSVLPKEASPIATVSYLDDGSFVLNLSDSDEVIRYANLQEFSEKYTSLSYDLFFTEETAAMCSDSLAGAITYPIEGSDHTGLIVSSTDYDSAKSLGERYARSLIAIKRFREKPSSFVEAWNVLDTHPAFWLNKKFDKTPLLWETESLMGYVRQEVYYRDGRVIVRLEAGGHVEKASHCNPAYSTHYGDWILEVEAPTFEEAVVKLAQRVIIRFNDDGSSREDAASYFEKPKWVQDLEEGMAEEDRL